MAFVIGYGHEGTDGWGQKNWVAARGQLAAVGVSVGNNGWFAPRPDNFEEVSGHFAQIAAFVKEMTAAP